MKRNNPEADPQGRREHDDGRLLRPAYARITQEIVASLERGVVPWRRPWLAARNVVSGRPYRGVNALLLSTLCHSSPWWLTFCQARQLGGTVRKGERGVTVIFWKPQEDEEERRPPILRSYTVFNLEQCDGITAPPTPGLDVAREEIVARMPSPPHIEPGRVASYHRATDTVTMPALASFENADAYYATLFHELAHATGHERRLGRPEVAEQHEFGSAAYAREELVAEIVAAFLCGETAVAPRTVENATAYIDGWLRVLGRQPGLLVHAAAAAQRAADYILGHEPGKGLSCSPSASLCTS
jgi:antirestriction protein ArdC